MKAQFINYLMSSFYLYLDHKILKKGEAFLNVSSLYYPATSPHSNYALYTAPYQPLVYDNSIPNATIMTGVYIGNTFTTKGQNGLIDINYDKNQLLFSSAPSQPVSGSYALKDYNIVLINDQETKLLFETKYSARPKISHNLTGLIDYSQTFPIIFVRSNGGQNKPFAFGGMDDTITQISVIMLWDSEFTRDAATQICQDLAHSYVPILTTDKMPFNAFGGLKAPYNYEQITANWTDNAYITRAKVNQFNQNVRTEVNTLNPSVYPSFIDFELSYPRMPRQ